VVLVGGVLLAIGLLGGDDEGGGARDRGQKPAGGKHQGRAGGDEQKPKGSVTLALSIHQPVQICLVGGGGQALIDGQVLNPGDEESYERKSFELRFPSGFEADQFRLEIAGEPRRLPKENGPAAFDVIAPQRVLEADPPGKECP
jgi:hypothetical protein